MVRPRMKFCSGFEAIPEQDYIINSHVSMIPRGDILSMQVPVFNYTGGVYCHRFAGS